MDELKALLATLIAQPSVTPDDAGCQEIMIAYLEKLGFECTRFNQSPVHNFFASYGKTGPLFVFAGHTDVVPPGDLSQWETPPFQLVEKGTQLYGRGVADMKGGLVSALVAAKRFIQTHPDFPGRLGFLITSGEEGNDYEAGTPYVLEQLAQQGISIDYCLIAEPSSTYQVGDTIKVGRRGSLSAQITVRGKQGHVAYPHLADNVIHRFAPTLQDLCSIVWDEGNTHFPPSTMQITSLKAGGLAGNVIPGEMLCELNFRYSTEQTVNDLKTRVLDLFKKHAVNAQITWRHSGEPFLCQNGQLLSCTQSAIQIICGQRPELSTSGGTSDGRFIAKYCAELLELGLTNVSIHKINESIGEAELAELEKIYFQILKTLLLS